MEEMPGFIVITINNKSYFFYNRFDSNYLFYNTIKFLKFLLNKYTNDAILKMVSEIEFIHADLVNFRGYDGEGCGSDFNEFGYVVDDEDRTWNNRHLSLFKIFRDKKAYWNRCFDGIACPNIILDFDNEIVYYSEFKPTKTLFGDIKKIIE